MTICHLLHNSWKLSHSKPWGLVNSVSVCPRMQPCAVRYLIQWQSSKTRQLPFATSQIAPTQRKPRQSRLLDSSKFWIGLLVAGAERGAQTQTGTSHWGRCRLATSWLQTAKLGLQLPCRLQHIAFRMPGRKLLYCTVSFMAVLSGSGRLGEEVPCHLIWIISCNLIRWDKMLSIFNRTAAMYR